MSRLQGHHCLIHPIHFASYFKPSRSPFIDSSVGLLEQFCFSHHRRHHQIVDVMFKFHCKLSFCLLSFNFNSKVYISCRNGWLHSVLFCFGFFCACCVCICPSVTSLQYPIGSNDPCSRKNSWFFWLLLSYLEQTEVCSWVQNNFKEFFFFLLFGRDIIVENYY